MTCARLHAMTQQEGRTSPDVIIGTLLIFGQPAFVLIDPGATYSFMSSRFALHANVLSSSLPVFGKFFLGGGPRTTYSGFQGETRGGSCQLVSEL